MPVISSRADTEALTLTYVGEYPSEVERVWQLWADARQLARWWGPPSWPAVVEPHDLVAGGESRYEATGPDGEVSIGWWTTTAVEPPVRLEYDEGFAGEYGEPIDYLDPVHVTVTLELIATGTRVTWVMRFPDRGQQDQMLDVGMEDGVRESLAQIDAVLAEEMAGDR